MRIVAVIIFLVFVGIIVGSRLPVFKQTVWTLPQGFLPIYSNQNKPEDFPSVPEKQNTDKNNQSPEIIVNKNHNPSGDNYIDIVLISDSYKDIYVFLLDVKKYEEYLLKQVPYSEYADRIHFHSVTNSSDLNCVIGPTKVDTRVLLHCDTDRVYTAVKASGVPYDKIAVIINDKPSGTTAYGDVAFIPNGINTEQLFVHELSHTFGLADEYVVKAESGPQSDACSANCCASSKCVDWQGIAGSQCIRGCTYPNWYRSSENSLMGDRYGFNQLNVVSIQFLRQSFEKLLKPDLAVLDNGLSWSTVGSAHAGDKINLSSIAWNIGGAASNPTRMRVSLDTGNDGVIDNVIVETPLPKLQPGAKAIFRWDTIWIAQAGTHGILYCIKNDNSFSDSYEKNNCAKNVITIAP